MPKRFDVKGLRDRMGISQVDLADRMGIHPRTIQRWENAEADPSPMATRLLQDIHEAHARSMAASEQTPTNNALTRAARGLIPSL